MKSIKTITETQDMKGKLSALWLFAMLTYTYGDVVTLMDPIKQESIQLTEGFPFGRFYIYDDSAFDGAYVPFIGLLDIPTILTPFRAC